MTNERHPIGETAGATGISPRMLRYLEEHDVLRPDRVPGPQLARRHFPPHEVRIARVAGEAMEAGAATATLAALRSLADARVARTVAAGDPLAWFELLALAAAVDAAARASEPPPPPPRPHDSPERHASPDPHAGGRPGGPAHREERGR